MTNLQSTLRILGIDPGLNITGYGVLDVGAGPPRLCEAGVVRGKSRGSLTGRQRPHGTTGEIEQGHIHRACRGHLEADLTRFARRIRPRR